MVHRLALLVMLCLAHFYAEPSQAPNEEIVHCQSSYEYDVAGNPVALKVSMQQTLIPVVDGMRLEWQREERFVEQVFLINQQRQISQSKNTLSIQIQKPSCKIQDFSKKFCNPQSCADQKKLSGFYTDAKIVAHQKTVFESMSNVEIMQAILYDQYCKACYHMSSAEKYQMMNLSYQKFEQKLLSDVTMQDQFVLQLWNEYKQKRLWNYGCQKEIHGQSIQKNLKQRDKKRKAEIKSLFAKVVQQETVKAEQKLLQTHQDKRLQAGAVIEASYEKLKEFTHNHGIVADEYWQKFDQALEVSKLQNYEQYEMRYELDDQTRGYLLYRNIGYAELELFHGTDLQHAYHKEICDQLKNVAEKQATMWYENDWLKAACDMSCAAYEVNKKEFADATGALYWIGKQLADYAVKSFDLAQRYGNAVLQGVVESTQDFVHMVVNPCETLSGIGKMINFVLVTLALEEVAVDFSHDPHIVALAQQRRDQISEGMCRLVCSFSRMDGPQRVKALTKFGSDFVIPGKIIGACAHVLGGVCKSVKGLRKLEGAATILGEDFGLLETFELAVEGANNLAKEEGAAEILSEFLEAENYLSKADRTTRPLRVLIDEIRNVHKGVIPFDRIDLLEELRVVLKEIQLRMQTHVSSEFLKKYARRVIDKNGKKYDINLDINHMLNVEFNFLKKKSLGGYKIDIKGGHFSGKCKILEEVGLVKVIKKKKLRDGRVKYLLENNFTGELFYKTEFARNWSAQKIVESAWNIFEIGAISPGEQGKFVKKAMIEGIEMSIVVKYYEEACNVITMLPYVEKIII